MDLPPLDHPIWLDIISGNSSYQFENLAVRMLQRTLARSAAADPSPENLLNCAKMLQELFAQNISSPSIQSDLRKIFADRKLDAL